MSNVSTSVFEIFSSSREPEVSSFVVSVVVDSVNLQASKFISVESRDVTDEVIDAIESVLDSSTGVSLPSITSKGRSSSRNDGVVSVSQPVDDFSRDVRPSNVNSVLFLPNPSVSTGYA